MTRAFAIVVASFVVAAGCGGQSVEPLDVRDLSLSDETRRWLADAEDAVIAARARVERLREAEMVAEEWQENIEETVHFSDSRLNSSLAQLANKRVALATSELEHAELGVDFAIAKYELATAERAILHDRGSYDLKPLQGRVDALRKQIRDGNVSIRNKRNSLQRTEDAWWQGYAQFVAGGGNTQRFWIGDAKPVAVSSSKPRK